MLRNYTQKKSFFNIFLLSLNFLQTPTCFRDVSTSWN